VSSYSRKQSPERFTRPNGAVLSHAHQIPDFASGVLPPSVTLVISFGFKKSNPPLFDFYIISVCYFIKQYMLFADIHLTFLSASSTFRRNPFHSFIGIAPFEESGTFGAG
jgi:hypothetical protein